MEQSRLGGWRRTGPLPLPSVGEDEDELNNALLGGFDGTSHRIHKLTVGLCGRTSRPCPHIVFLYDCADTSHRIHKLTVGSCGLPS